jgi:hypothetical protein
MFVFTIAPLVAGACLLLLLTTNAAASVEELRALQNATGIYPRGETFCKFTIYSYIHSVLLIMLCIFYVCSFLPQVSWKLYGH